LGSFSKMYALLGKLSFKEVLW